MAVNILNLAKTGFGLGLGFYALQIITLLIGMAFFIPGLKMVRQSKERNEGTSNNYIIGMILLVVGVVVMGGIGFSQLVNNI
jgi:hypothetical protein